MAGPEQAPEIGPKHIFVTGGCGFLGQHISRLTWTRFPDAVVTIADLDGEGWARATLESDLSFSAAPGLDGLKPGQRVGPPPSERVRYVNCDITDADSVRKSLFPAQLPAVDAVIHTASPRIDAPREVLRRVNVDGTAVLLAAAKKAGVKAFVYTSSASVSMGKSLELVNADESWPAVVEERLSPEYYSLTKAMAEVNALNANDRQAPFLTAAIRPSGIFGECDGQVLLNLVNTSRQGKTGFVIGSGANRFDFTYVVNIAHGHLLALGKLLEQHGRLVAGKDGDDTDQLSVDGEAFFITNDEPIYFWDFARAVWQRCGDNRPPSKQVFLPAWLALGIASVVETATWLLGLPAPALTRSKVQFSAIDRTYNIAKAKERLGYVPVVGLEAALNRSVPWHL